MHEALKPISWLKGLWKTKNVGLGKYPTIKSFEYCEEMSFRSIGQPMLNYTARSWYADSKKPIHYEVGFLKIIPDTNKVYLLLSHNRGYITIEEGTIENEIIKLKTASLRIPKEGTTSPQTTELQREFRLVGDCLQHTLCMATTTTPELQEHLCATYIKECEKVE
ncbi:THAP domain-containing protein 4 [Dufourea novaeangliae]|uniref:THAP domain-containing protein 4 n=2 Tax=Dufourea novaeangliae TaxID=178035 RepID=A0A154PRW9_DUFNO|nr:THAP domain-containing protein 4 [Dufourea novaeangliae]